MPGRVNKFTSAYQNRSNVTDQVIEMMQEEIAPSDKNSSRVSEETILQVETKPTRDVLEADNQSVEYPAIRPIGRPKVYDYKMHPLQTRIREDLFEYAQSQCGKGKKYQSVNAYLNELILKEMQSNQ